jgi:ribonuclease D
VENVTQPVVVNATPIPQVPFQLLLSDAELAAACARWQHCDMVALDTEFMRVSTFYPQVGLIQLAAGNNEVTLIDPVGITDWSPFKALMVNPAVLKVLHSCSEDMLVFLTFLQVLPTPIFDTQIAGSLLGEGTALSYQNLVKQRYGVELPKGETRSDWLQRPLTPEQLEYAALDVVYLLQCCREQQAELQAKSRTAWMSEECERVALNYADEINGKFDDYYLNFKSAWQLRPRSLLALQQLAIWREQRARSRNKPRSWILKDAAVFIMANNMVQSKAQLAAVPEVSDNFVRHEGETVLAIIAAASVANEADCPPKQPAPLTNGQKAYLKQMQEVVETKAQQLAIPPDMLGRKRALLPLLYAILALPAGVDKSSASIPLELQGWRKPLVLVDLLAIFS